MRSSLQRRAQSRCAFLIPLCLTTSPGKGASQPVSQNRDALIRVACRLQYNGASFHGWESKPALRTAEALIADAVSEVAGVQTSLTAASRTDSGTHAVGQVVHFDVRREKSMQNARAWVGALNRRLPNDVRISEAAFVHPSFDARRSAESRTYRYSILTSKEPSVFLAPLTWHYYQRNLNVSKMHAAAQFLKSVQPRDLSAFRKSGAPADHTLIKVNNISVRRIGVDEDVVQIEVEASWFVYGMMRLLSATLVQVGVETITEAEFGAIVRESRRQDVKFSAPPNGLCLMNVQYPVVLDPFSGPTHRDGALQVASSVPIAGM